MWDAVGALVPSIGVGLIFWFAVRAMLHADRRERQVMARYDAEARRVAESAPESAPESPPESPPEAAPEASAHDDEASIDAAGADAGRPGRGGPA